MTDDSSIVGLEIENIAKAVKRTNQSNSQIQNNSRSLDDSSKSEIKSKIEELNDKVNTLDFDKETQPPKTFGGTLSKLNTLNFEDTSPIFKIKGRETPTPSVIEECRYTIMKMLDEPVSGRNFPLKNQNLNTSLTHKEGSKTTKNANSNAKSAFNYFNNVNSTTKNDNNNNTGTNSNNNATAGNGGNTFSFFLKQNVLKNYFDGSQFGEQTPINENKLTKPKEFFNLLHNNNNNNIFNEGNTPRNSAYIDNDNNGNNLGNNNTNNNNNNNSNNNNMYLNMNVNMNVVNQPINYYNNIQEVEEEENDNSNNNDLNKNTSINYQQGFVIGEQNSFNNMNNANAMYSQNLNEMIRRHGRTHTDVHKKPLKLTYNSNVNLNKQNSFNPNVYVERSQKKKLSATMLKTTSFTNAMKNNMYNNPPSNNNYNNNEHFYMNTNQPMQNEFTQQMQEFNYDNSSNNDDDNKIIYFNDGDNEQMQYGYHNQNNMYNNNNNLIDYLPPNSQYMNNNNSGNNNNNNVNMIVQQNQPQQNKCHHCRNNSATNAHVGFYINDYYQGTQNNLQSQSSKKSSKQNNSFSNALNTSTSSVNSNTSTGVKERIHHQSTFYKQNYKEKQNNIINTNTNNNFMPMQQQQQPSHNNNNNNYYMANNNNHSIDSNDNHGNYFFAQQPSSSPMQQIPQLQQQQQQHPQQPPLLMHSNSSNNLHNTNNNNMPNMNMSLPNQQQLSQQNFQKRKLKATPPYNVSSMSLSEIIKNSNMLCRDQTGCRFLQKKLEEQPDIYNKILKNAFQNLIEIITDPFGNYLIQKLFEYMTNEQFCQFLALVHIDLYTICVNSCGTRVIQRIIDFLNTDELLLTFLRFIKPIIKDIILDINGSHILLKLFDLQSPIANKILFAEINANIVAVAKHKHGCCVLQKIIDKNANENEKMAMFKLFIYNCKELITDQCGNYIIQFVIELGYETINNCIVDVLCEDIQFYSKQKFSSNVVEKCFENGNKTMWEKLIMKLIETGSVVELLFDKFGNYVIQKALQCAEENVQKAMLGMISPHLQKLKNFNFGMKLYSKLIITYPYLSMVILGKVDELNGNEELVQQNDCFDNNTYYNSNNSNNSYNYANTNNNK